jgi:diguanylate cyclase (GGDEF)-like protein
VTRPTGPTPSGDASPFSALLGDGDRLLRLEQIGMGERGGRAAESLDRLTRLASHLLGAPVALVSLVGEDRQVFASQIGLAEPWATRSETPLSHSFCQHAVTTGEPLVIADARKHPLVHDNPAITDLGVVAYAGIPLHVGRQCVGSFCVIDSVPREWRDEELSLLRDIAAAATTELELRWALAEREIADEQLRHSATALAEGLARYQSLARHIPDGAVFLFDQQFRHLLAEGPIAGQLTDGMDPAGLTPSEVFPRELGERIEGLYGLALAGAPQAFRATSAEGREYDVTITAIHSDGSVVGGMALALDVTERARLEAEQSALRDIAHAVAEGATADALFGLVVERVARLFGAVGAAVFRFDDPEHAVLLAAAPIAPGEFLTDPRVPLDATTAIGRVAETGLPALVADYGDADDQLVRALRGLGAVGGLAAPVKIRQRLWGALGLGSAIPERLTDETASRLAHFAELVATHIGNVEAWDALTHEATTDLLTGLPNRRSFVDRFGAEMARSRRFAHPLSLVLLDVDHFKAVNDTHGHLAGDEILTTMAGVIAKEAREGEMIARIGGEEFAVLLPETDAGAAVSAAERMRRAVADAGFGGVGRITISLGVAEMRAGDEPDDVLRRADQALYAAKARGRNATHSWVAEDGRRPDAGLHPDFGGCARRG